MDEETPLLIGKVRRVTSLSDELDEREKPSEAEFNSSI